VRKSYIGTDLGGTTFSSAVFDRALNLIQSSPKKLIIDFDSADALLTGISQQIRSLVEGEGLSLSAVGLSCPGPLNAKEGVILETPNLKLLRNIPVAQRLKGYLEVPIFIENDANLFAIGEYRLLESQSSSVLLGITLGSGTGVGVVIDGHSFTGAHGMGAEYGISPVEWGSWESGISIRYLEEQSLKRLGDRLSPAKLCELASQDHTAALAIWKEYGGRLGLFLSHLINLLDPDKIIVGGGISHAFRFFEITMRETLEKYSPAYRHYSIDISESCNKELSSIIGAAELAKKGVGNS